MSFHDPIRQTKYLRQTLSQDKKPIGFFIAAGCPLAVQLPQELWPLIPDVMKLTQHVSEEILKETKILEGENRSTAECYKVLLEELTKTGKAMPNIEDILSFVRGMLQIAKGSSDVRGLQEIELKNLESCICRTIADRLKVSLPDNKTPYHKLAKWINNIERDTPVEIFTTNYDLLMEGAFEALKLPYFDGFVGTQYPFFDLRAVEDNLIPMHWTRLWKIHGSINWYQKNTQEVYRSNVINTSDAYIIHPSHLKYDQSRKMPYLALIDRLNKFLRQNSAVLVMSGYSFSDDHLNDTIINALRANPTALVIALMYGSLTYIEQKDDGDGSKLLKTITRYENALKLAENRSNLSVWAYDEAIIGGLRAKWYPIISEFSAIENIGNAVIEIPESIKDAEGNDTDKFLTRYEVHLGDFAILGNYLQELIGKEQFKLNSDGN